MKLRRVKRPELKIAIQMMIDGGRRKYCKKYFRPTLKTMVRLLAERQRIQTSTRTISRAIKELVDDFIIYRKNRHTRGKGIKMVCRATAYYLLDKAAVIFKNILRQAQRFLFPLGEPKVALDKVTLEHVFSKSFAPKSLGGVHNPLKEVASLHQKHFIPASPVL